MNAEERVLEAIRLARIALGEILNDADRLVQMAINDSVPEQVEDTIAAILEYLDKTREEEKPHG